MVRVARTTSLDDMHLENIWFSWYKLSKYRDVPGGGGDQDDRPGQEVEGVPGERESQRDG